MISPPAAGVEQGAEDRVFQTFPTTVLLRTYPNAGQLNAALAHLVRRLRDSPGNAVTGTSSVGGFQTDNEFLKIDDPAIRTLRGLVNNAVQAFLGAYLPENMTRPPQNVEAEVWGWAVLMRRNDYNMPHVHPDAHVSGVYYVEVPAIVPSQSLDEVAPGGSLAFFDPRGAAEMFRIQHHRTHHCFIPTPGSLIVFPSYHRHAVFPYRNDAERISIAFNGRLVMR